MGRQKSLIFCYNSKKEFYAVSDKKTCFVIQPFESLYDERYETLYKPAIEKAGLVADRVDKDPSVEDFAAETRNKIKMARTCIADISLDNPNVWYEVGFAHWQAFFGNGNPVIMVCDKQVRSANDIPSDIKVKSIVFYDGEQLDSSTKYCMEIQRNVAERIKARVKAAASSGDTSVPKTGDTALPSKSADNGNLNDVKTTILKKIVSIDIDCNHSLPRKRYLDPSAKIYLLVRRCHLPKCWHC